MPLVLSRWTVATPRCLAYLSTSILESTLVINATLSGLPEYQYPRVDSGHQCGSKVEYQSAVMEPRDAIRDQTALAERS